MPVGSSHDPREVLGLGQASEVDELEVHWAPPSKRIDKFAKLRVDCYIHIVEGKGVV